ncbi:MAG: hypothetical protein HPY73_08655 [Methanomassiliicoccales archaeon]|nr:MAG: hypothetical protein HPY73_08655 [Methanomassiliicoccales archaeon]
MGSDQRSLMRSKVIDELMVFGITRPAKVLCRCGAIAEIDRSVLRTKKDLGKVIECRRCRSMRIAREKEELDNDYYGMQESLE